MTIERSQTSRTVEEFKKIKSQLAVMKVKYLKLVKGIQICCHLQISLKIIEI